MCWRGLVRRVPCRAPWCRCLRGLLSAVACVVVELGLLCSGLCCCCFSPSRCSEGGGHGNVFVGCSRDFLKKVMDVWQPLSSPHPLPLLSVSVCLSVFVPDTLCLLSVCLSVCLSHFKMITFFIITVVVSVICSLLACRLAGTDCKNRQLTKILILL